MRKKKFIKYLRRSWHLSKRWRLFFDESGMLHIYDPSGASAAWMGDGRQF